MTHEHPPISAPAATWRRYRGLFLACYLGFWTSLGLVNVTQNYLLHIALGRPFFGWGTLAISMTDWYLWASLGPLIIFLARRFRFQKGRWPASLAVHVATNLALTILIAAVMAHLIKNFGCDEHSMATLGQEIPFWEWFQRLLIGGFVFYVWIYWTILGACYAVDYYRLYRDRELRASHLETELAQAELLVLKMQLHPHFLFNTLHAISALMHMDVRLADRMLARLAELLRSTLDNVGTQEVPLRRELEFVRPYLEIEQARLGTRLAVDFHIDPETLDALIPNLILQPLVENAVRHGIAPYTRPGRIEVRALRQGEQLCLEVRDNGPGLPSHGAVALRAGVGLSNTQARLRHLYGDAYQFEFGNAPGGGALVRLILPFRENHPDEVPADDTPGEIAC